MAVEYWLINGKERVRLPVNPESNEYSSPYSYTNTEVEGLGAIIIPGRRGLKEFKIDTFWPRHYNPAYCGYKGFMKPGDFIKKMEKWRSARKPIRYIVTGAGAVNLQVVIQSIEVTAEQAGSPGDIYFSLELKEYREIKISKTKAAKKKKSSRPSAPKPAPAKTYTVRKGDCLWNIAKKKSIYGNASKWRKIYNANKKLIGKNPNLIYPGQKLVIPK